MKNNALRSLIIVITLALAIGSLGVSGALRTANSQANKSQAKRTEGPCPAVEPVVGNANSALQALKCGNERWRNKLCLH